MRYDVDADIYEGSLSLLVELSKLHLVDIFLIKLVDLTNRYLLQVKASGLPAPDALLRSAEQNEAFGAQAGVDLNELAEPLPLLGQLLALKARGLLPQAPPPEEDEAPISMEELERRLKEYEQFKTVAQLLAELHALQHQHFTRMQAEAPPVPGEALPDDRPFEVSLTDLMSAFAGVLEKASAPVYTVQTEPWTVEMKVQELRVLLTVKRATRFLDLFTPDKSKLELVVTFLALLELMRQRFARAIQDRPFADILITTEPAGETDHG